MGTRLQPGFAEYVFCCALCAALLFAGCPQSPPPEDTPPTAAFSAAPTSGAPGLRVQFTDASEPGSSAITEWYWNFGDGATSGEQHPAHVYGAEGVYTVGLRVSSAVDADMVIHEALIRVTRAPDTSPPLISLTGVAEVMLECGVAAWEDPGATAVDDRDPMVQVLVGGDAVGLELGVYTITYDAVDEAGNRAAQVRRVVRVADTVAPLITLKGGDGVLECGEAWVDPGATALDVCDGAVEVVVSNAINTSQAGVQTLVYTATDGSGNASQVTRVVRVLDTMAPVISLVGGDVALECGEGYEDPGATAVDECEGAVEVVSNAINTSQAGVQTLVYTATDGSGNSSQVTRTVGVVDTLAPLLSLVGGDVVLECGEAFSEPGATAVDGCDGELAVEVSGDIGASVGEYPLTYRAVDGAGNAALPMARRVTVVDFQPPQITMTGGDMSIYRGVPFRDPGARAWDACDGNVAVVAGGEAVDTRRTGEFTLTYDAEDAAGNVAAQKQRRVTVIEPCPDAGPWATVFGRNDQDGQVAQLSDCSLLYVSQPEPSSLRMRKLSAEGDVIWTREIDPGYRVHDVVASAGGGALLVGQRAITRISNSGNVQWEVSAPFGSRIGKVVEAPDGRLWIQGYGNTEPDLEPAALVSVLEANGALLWSRVYEVGTIGDVAVAPEGGLVMVGGELNPNLPRRMVGAVTSIDLNGDVRWHRLYPREEYNDDWSFSDVAATRTGFVLTGPPRAGHWSSCTAMDSQGEVLWEKSPIIWNPDVAVTLDQEVLLVERPDYYRLVGWYGNVAITKLDLAGNLLWRQEFGEHDDAWALDFTPTFSGGIAVTTRAEHFVDAGDPEMVVTFSAEGTAPDVAGFSETPGWMSRYRLSEATELGDFIVTETGFGLLARGEGASWIVQTDPEGRPLQHVLVSKADTESHYISEHPLGFVLSDVVTSGDDGGAHLRCVSLAGETLWDRQIHANPRESTGLVRGAGGDVYLAIGNLRGTGTAYATCVDGEGNILWEWESADSARCRLYAAAALGDGDWVVAGQGLQGYFVVRISREGSVWWQRDYEAKGSVRCIAELPGGDLIFAGTDERSQQTLVAARTTREGEVLWQRVLVHGSSGTYSHSGGWAKDVTALPNGDIYLLAHVAGGFAAPGLTSWSADKLWRLDPSGDVLQSLSFGQSFDKIVPAGEGNFVFGTSSEGRPALVKFTPTGETAVVYEDFVLE